MVHAKCRHLGKGESEDQIEEKLKGRNSLLWSNESVAHGPKLAFNCAERRHQMVPVVDRRAASKLVPTPCGTKPVSPRGGSTISPSDLGSRWSGPASIR